MYRQTAAFLLMLVISMYMFSLQEANPIGRGGPSGPMRRGAAAQYNKFCDVGDTGKYHPYACADLKLCISTSHLCDGVEQCKDGSDEVDCDKR